MEIFLICCVVLMLFSLCCAALCLLVAMAWFAPWLLGFTLIAFVLALCIRHSRAVKLNARRRWGYLAVMSFVGVASQCFGVTMYAVGVLVLALVGFLLSVPPRRLPAKRRFSHA